MKPPRWLSRQAVLALHDQSIAMFGGSSGLRDEGLLDSALTRPLNLFSYQSPTLFELAAAYGYGLAKNHAFVDGNKRTAFLAGALFMEYNGYAFTADEVNVVVTMTELAAGRLSEAELAAWFKVNCIKQK